MVASSAIAQSPRTLVWWACHTVAGAGFRRSVALPASSDELSHSSVNRAAVLPSVRDGDEMTGVPVLRLAHGAVGLECVRRGASAAHQLARRQPVRLVCKQTARHAQSSAAADLVRVHAQNKTCK